MPALVWKAIKPSKMRAPGVRAEVRNSARRMATQIKQDFDKTVKTWTRKPKFEKITSTAGGNVAVLVGTDNEIYGYVSRGTKPHRIEPKNAPFLVFQTGYKAKTTPNVIGSTVGGPTGPTVRAKGVTHPGTDARNFDEVITKKWEPRFKREMEAAMKRGLRKGSTG